MTARETRRYEMLLRVRDFGRTHREALTGSSAAQTALATVGAAVDELAALDVVRLSASASGRADDRRTARRALAALLASVSRLARLLRAEGQTMPPFSRPRSRSDQALLTTARVFAQDVEPFAEEFRNHELQPERLAQAIAAFEAAVRTRGSGCYALTASRTRIRDLLRRAELAVRRLDLIIANRPDTETAVQVVWRQARRIEARKRRSRGDKRPVEAVGHHHQLLERTLVLAPSLPHRPLAALPAAGTPTA